MIDLDNEKAEYRKWRHDIESRMEDILIDITKLKGLNDSSTQVDYQGLIKEFMSVIKECDRQSGKA